MMRSLLFLLGAYFTSLLTGCTTAGDVAYSGGLRVGMSKSEVRNALLYTTLAEDPFLTDADAVITMTQIRDLAAESETLYLILHMSLGRLPVVAPTVTGHSGIGLFIRRDDAIRE